MYRPLPATATEGTFREWFTPMAATLTDKRFSGPDWVFERKFDGIRLLTFKQGGDVRLLSRNRLPPALPTVAEAVARLPVENLILDDELTWQGGASYHVFDVMWLSGRT
jgi:bifunctional non-homologous end joining protein LigD